MENRFTYGPRYRDTITNNASTAVSQHGYAMPVEIEVAVEPVIGGLKGQSPSSDVNGVKYFGGRTIIFTHHPGHLAPGVMPPAPRDDFDEQATIAMVHELTHAFGLPHKCGAYHWRTPRTATCAMNYPPNWMLDAADQLLRGTDSKVGLELCARH